MRPIEAFKPSGKTTPVFLIVVVLFAAALGAASWLYTALLGWIPWIYLNLLVLLGFAGLVGIGAYMAAQLGKNRNAILGAVAGLAIGVVGAGGSHYFAYSSALDDVVEELAQIGEIEQSRDELRAELEKELGFGDFIDARVEAGWSIGRSSSSGNFTGFFVWLIWAIEALAILAAGVIGGYLSSRSPFCEPCSQWMEEEELLNQDVDWGEVETLSVATSVEGIIGLVVSPKTEPSSVSLKYVGKQCASCNGDAYLSISKHWQEEEKGELEDKSEDVHSDIAISGEDLQHLRALASQPHSAERSEEDAHEPAQ